MKSLRLFVKRNRIFLLALGPIVVILALICCRVSLDLYALSLSRQLNDAACLKNYAKVKQLLDRGANPNVEVQIGCGLLRDYVHKITGNSSVSREERPLSTAAELGNVAIVRLLLDRGAEVNATAEDDNSPLVHAILNGKQDLACLLIERGAEVNCKTLDHKTSGLAFAIETKQTKVIAALRKAGAR